MHNTGNPIGSDSLLDLYDNSSNIDQYVNSQEDTFPDRFGVKRLTLAGLIKRSMALRNEINDFSGALTFKPEWSDVPMNVSEGVGGVGGALNLQAEALGNRTEINKITSREALRRTYQEVGLNLVAGSFEEGGVLYGETDVMITSNAEGFSWTGVFPPSGLVVRPGTDPTTKPEFISRTESVSLRVYADYFKKSVELDYTNSIKRGIKFCIDNKLSTLYFRAGTYDHSGTLGECPINLVSDGETTIRNTDTNTLASASGEHVIVFKPGMTLIKGIVFDGQVSSTVGTYNKDPDIWNSNNYNTWYGYQGPIFTEVSGFSVIDCHAKNFYRAGFYVSKCSDFTLIRVKTKRNRGNFGDGIFIGNGSHDFTINNHHAHDFTRGGLVCDMGCYDFNITDNVASYGHNWSALYGGTEYSAGLWIEKCTRGTVSGGRLYDTGYFGVILALEIDGYIPVNYREHMTLNIRSTQINGSLIGLNCRNAAGVKGKIEVNNVDVTVNSANTAMLLRGYPGLTIEVIGGSAKVAGSIAGQCIAVGSLGQNGVVPVYLLQGVGMGHITPAGAVDAKGRLGTSDVGDVCVYTQAEYDFQLTMSHCYSLSDPTEILIGLRTPRITPSWHIPSIEINTITHPVYYLDNSLDTKLLFKARDVVFSKLKTHCLGFIIQGCTITGVGEIYFNSLWKFGYNIIRDTVFLSSQNIINYVGPTPVYSLTPAMMLDSCRFSGDLSGLNSFLVDIRRVDLTGNRIGFLQRDVIYTNTGSNGSGAVAINCPLGDYNLPAYKYSNVFDVLITNVMKTSNGIVSDPVSINVGVRENLVLSS